MPNLTPIFFNESNPMLQQSAIKRKPTKTIQIGNVKVGGESPISVQSMTNTPTQDINATVDQIKRLESAGCEIIRVAVPDMDAALAISKIKQQVRIPLIADIHFDHRLAISAAENGADALRINPGNIGDPEQVKKVVQKAKEYNIAIRIGVNSGSVEKDLLNKYGGPTAQAMVESALRHIKLMQSLDFDNIKLSIKASDVPRTLTAYRLLSEQTNAPLHVGVTEAGTLISGTVKSALGIGMLLAEGIGDTIRVSLTRDPVEEVRVAYEILRALNIRRRGPEIISCPTCGRTSIPLFEIVESVEKRLQNVKSDIKVAIMGCAVNGPGEAREADVGIAGGDGKGILFKKGKVIKKFPQNQLIDALIDAVNEFDQLR
ncbi:4-hydroxy-3-methylbut-2-en-1-yl diphosphate synthase [Candidatus Magnetomorum sp. HK-1]|nr:4-hydroxy-3-methylbut-2-en-1-yl diphosphate synthase [Candidatus Magnetomorum sp. HK-1]